MTFPTTAVKKPKGTHCQVHQTFFTTLFRCHIRNSFIMKSCYNEFIFCRVYLNSTGSMSLIMFYRFFIIKQAITSIWCTASKTEKEWNHMMVAVVTHLCFELIICTPCILYSWVFKTAVLLAIDRNFMPHSVFPHFAYSPQHISFDSSTLRMVQNIVDILRKSK